MQSNFGYLGKQEQRTPSLWKFDWRKGGLHWKWKQRTIWNLKKLQHHWSNRWELGSCFFWLSQLFWPAFVSHWGSCTSNSFKVLESKPLHHFFQHSSAFFLFSPKWTNLQFFRSSKHFSQRKPFDKMRFAPVKWLPSWLGELLQDSNVRFFF